MLKQFLLNHNKKQSELFISPDAALQRRLYRAKYPTEIAALKCMDGRLNLSLMTNTPPGIILPFRNIGGIFDVGWPFFGTLLLDFANYAVRKGRYGLIFVTYHWSKGDSHRGCKGFKYEMEASRTYTQELQKEVEDVFGLGRSIIYPIQVGVETDEDALVLHGNNGEILDLATASLKTEEDFLKAIERLFPDMPDRIRKDLVPLLIGNIAHINYIRSSKRPLEDAQHKEQILAIGRGFDWLHLPNKALIVGPYSYDLEKPISTAAKLLQGNLAEGRIPKNEGLVLLASASFRDEAGPERIWAAKKAQSLAKLALKVIRQDVPELESEFDVLVGTMNLNTRLFTPIEQ